MRKLLYAIVLVNITLKCTAQGVKTVEDSLLQLSKTNRILDTYTNFDVLKVMIGHGRLINAPFSQGVGISIRGQFLWPYSISKNFLKIAYGIAFGYNKFQAQSTAFGLDGHQIVSIMPNNSINSMWRTSYVGPTVFRVTRLHSVTILTGASLEYNMFSKLKERGTKSVETIWAKKYVNSFSLPLHLQVSISRKQFAALGFWASYDTRPRFQGTFTKGMKQMAIGTSFSLII